MIAKSRIAAAALLAALSAPALAADPAQGAMTGDPNWPVVPQVAPSIALQQGPSTPAATEVDPTWSMGRMAPAGMVLHHEPLVDDPLQGLSDAGVRYAAAVGKSAPAAAEGAQAIACTASCKCHHG